MFKTSCCCFIVLVVVVLVFAVVVFVFVVVVVVIIAAVVEHCNILLEISNAFVIFFTSFLTQVVHRDLAARNMLINYRYGDNNRQFIVKIGDFGLARVVNKEGEFVADCQVWWRIFDKTQKFTRLESCVSDKRSSKFSWLWHRSLAIEVEETSDCQVLVPLENGSFPGVGVSYVIKPQWVV